MLFELSRPLNKATVGSQPSLDLPRTQLPLQPSKSPLHSVAKRCCANFIWFATAIGVEAFSRCRRGKQAAAVSPNNVVRQRPWQRHNAPASVCERALAGTAAPWQLQMLAVEHSGLSVNVGVRIEAQDRADLGRLLRYRARAPFALDRLG